MIINIIAPNIKNGGGLELLIYLVKYIAKQYPNLEAIVYVDKTLEMMQSTENIKVVYIQSSVEKIRLFYKKLDNALYFGNLPPLRKSKNSIVYFHNPYLLMNWKKLSSSSFKFFIKYSLQQIYISCFIKNVDRVACQSNLIKDEFIKKYNFMNVELLPFFRSCNKESYNFENKIYDFCYVSLAHPHKNHLLLLDAMEILTKEGISVNLALTIEDEKIELIDKINYINSLGVVKINNFGIIPKDEVCNLYAKSKCLIFPSKEETFGLGLIEAVNMGLDVIAADLEYVYEVVEPSLVFNVDSAKICAQTIKNYMNKKHKRSVGLVNNEVDTLINKLIRG
ncbi:MAG: glycosyltransferase [Candidatus Gracilibacteria bacterium]